jgi:hypothetical protein
MPGLFQRSQRAAERVKKTNKPEGLAGMDSTRDGAYEHGIGSSLHKAKALCLAFGTKKYRKVFGFTDSYSLRVIEILLHHNLTLRA